ncbi:MAG: MarR family transcriptional regulator [Firmicutes bacterium]|nr:MarR family transcriptional regulator [Alicyclobacillaceae bacterium]MCL6498243.1 MarR family transcriptional regulator [Bacillota bacterium]
MPEDHPLAPSSPEPPPRATDALPAGSLAATEAALRRRIRATLERYRHVTPGIHPELSELTILLMRSYPLLLALLNQDVRRHGLSEAQYSTLMILFRSPDRERTMSQLSEEMYVTRTNVTKLVTRLAAHGWVERAPDPHDRRTIRVRLTERGVALMTDTLQAHWDHLGDIYRHLKTTEQHRLAGLLYRLVAGWTLRTGQAAPFLDGADSQEDSDWLPSSSAEPPPPPSGSR